MSLQLPTSLPRNLVTGHTSCSLRKRDGGKQRADDRSWIDLEVQGSEFQDTQLHRRFATLLEKLWGGMGQTIPFVCQDWASTKAAYRFLSNHRVSEHDILSGHFQASAERVKASG